MEVIKSWEELQESNLEIKNCIPKLINIEKGTMYFNFEHKGVTYYASGSHCYISSYDWSPDETLAQASDFDNFWLYYYDNKKLIEVCNW